MKKLLFFFFLFLTQGHYSTAQVTNKDKHQQMYH